MNDAQSKSVDESDLIRLQKTLYTSKNPTRRWLHTTRYEWIVKALRQLAGERNGMALEIGPGSGIYLSILSSAFKDVAASDIEVSYLNHARQFAAQHSNLTLLVDDICHSAFADKSFDLILCTEVLEHLNDPERAVIEMHRILKPGGRLIITTPQRHSILELAAKIAFLPGIVNLVKLIYREPILEMGHINLMTEKKLSTLLEQSGFRILKRYKSGLYIPLVAEFLGNLGLKLEKHLESMIRGSFLDSVLWTQYYIVEA